MPAYVIPAGLASLGVFAIVCLITVNVKLAKRPTFGETDERYKKAEVCNEIHKSVDEKLSCIPEIKETVIEIKTILQERNGV